MMNDVNDKTKMSTREKGRQGCTGAERVRNTALMSSIRFQLHHRAVCGHGREAGHDWK